MLFSKTDTKSGSLQHSSMRSHTEPQSFILPLTVLLPQSGPTGLYCHSQGQQGYTVTIRAMSTIWAIVAVWAAYCHSLGYLLPQLGLLLQSGLLIATVRVTYCHSQDYSYIQGYCHCHRPERTERGRWRSLLSF